MATMSPLLNVDDLNIKESLVAADVNFISEGTPSLACMTACTFMPPFFLPVLGYRPTPLNSRLENSVIVVESIIWRRFIQTASLFLRLSAKMYIFAHS